MNGGAEGKLWSPKSPQVVLQALCYPCFWPPRQDNGGVHPPLASPDLWGPPRWCRESGPLPFLLGLHAPLGVSVAEKPSGEAFLNSGRQGAQSAHMAAHCSTPAHLARPPLLSLSLWLVSLGAAFQSCLLPMSKTCSFPSENTNHFLALQRTARMKWAVVS